MKQWDIFCKVVDNFGDIGVCWRLAKQLATEFPIQVRLWVDDLNTAQQIIPQLNTTLHQQSIELVDIRLWCAPLPHVDIADVVIEAFACELPEAYIAQMQAKPPVWINLEYLSAESWVEDTHLMPSPHPKTGLIKHFFFPGFNQKTGGLIREQHLIAARDALQANESLQAEWLSSIGVSRLPTQLLISLFCYKHANIYALLNAIASGEQAVLCLVPNTDIAKTVAQYFETDTLTLHKIYQQGNLSIQVIPFLSQYDYDRLLWCCDLNFVRGEDSWVRAIWSAQPFIWQPYPQDMETCTRKLNAFLQRYCLQLEHASGTLLSEAHFQWLSGTAMNINSLLMHLNTLKKHATMQSNKLITHTDLATQLYAFVEEVCHDCSRK